MNSSKIKNPWIVLSASVNSCIKRDLSLGVKSDMICLISSSGFCKEFNLFIKICWLNYISKSFADT